MEEGQGLLSTTGGGAADSTAVMMMMMTTTPLSRTLSESSKSAKSAAASAASSLSPTGTTTNKQPSLSSSSSSLVISKMGVFVLLLLACQNCGKNLILRFVMMKEHQPRFLTSTAVLVSECLKLSCSILYILWIQKKSWRSIIQFLYDDRRNTVLLAVPASAYNFQTSMEYVALANLHAAAFSVLVQTKLLCTAICSALILRKQLTYLQVISLLLLTTGVMLCNFPTTTNDTNHSNNSNNNTDVSADTTKGILATLGIALSSGFASVYTEKVIKGSGQPPSSSSSFASSSSPRKGVVTNMEDYGLAYTQVQLAGTSIVAIGIYAVLRDWAILRHYGLWYNFTYGAAVSCVMSALGGLIVASVLKYADSILKGYATALSVILTGVLSMLLFGTQLSTLYFLGILNVICAVLLYNGGKNLNQFMCSSSNSHSNSSSSSSHSHPHLQAQQQQQQQS
ncbi:hypothetical protein ACA910_006577 [Epithemia clementina (nom. ined.)]